MSFINDYGERKFESSQNRPMTMTDDFDLEFRKDHFLIRPGLKDKLDARSMQLWEALREVCTTRDCRRVLSEVGIFTDTMTYSEAYFSARLIAEKIPGIRIALCLTSNLSRDFMEFVELTAANRGIAIAFFSDPDKATDWLTNLNRDSKT